jgi:hypothetical protein
MKPSTGFVWTNRAPDSTTIFVTLPHERVLFGHSRQLEDANMFNKKDVSEPIIELAVYRVISPDRGLSHQVFDEQDIQASGGIHAIERTLERDSYWFIRLGNMDGQADHGGTRYRDFELSSLTVPPRNTWHVGRRNPSFRRPDLERLVFDATFGAVERLLESWSYQENGVVDAYALKELHIGLDCLIAITDGLRNLLRIHGVAGITVVKHWYDPDWPQPHEPDMILSEFSLDIPYRVQWSAGGNIIDAETLGFSSC